MTEESIKPNTLSIPDVATGSAYLSRLPLANPTVAEQQLQLFLDALLADPPSADTLLSLLELARVPLCFVEEEMARRYHSKSLPLGPDEEASFRLVLLSWEKMRRAYALCAQMAEPIARDPQFSGLIATVLHRCLYYSGMVILEHYRARRELPPGIWLDLHHFFETAEQWGVANTPLKDALESDLQATHCTAAYVTILLLDIASPFSNSVRNLNLIRRWAGLWAPLVSAHALNDDFELPPYIIELKKDAPLHPTNNAKNSFKDARHLDTSRLGLQINHMLSQLRQRMTPSQLGLGEETRGHVMTLLDQLSRPWTQSSSPRRFRRFASAGSARVVVSFDAMHFHISGTEFIQTDAASAYSRDQFDQLFTFREKADPGQKLKTRTNTDFPVDNWSVINHSANGFRLARSSAGQKITHSQLLSLCPHDGEDFLLAQSSWLMEESTGGLLMGVSVLPGLPQAVSFRPEGGIDGIRERFSRAFLLPAVPAINEEASLVLPKNFYQASRILELVIEGKSSQVRLKHIQQHGIDFDRSSFDIL